MIQRAGIGDVRSSSQFKVVTPVMSTARLLLARLSTLTKKLSLPSNSNAKATPFLLLLSAVSDGFKMSPGAEVSKAVLSIDSLTVIEEPFTYRASLKEVILSSVRVFAHMAWSDVTWL